MFVIHIIVPADMQIFGALRMFVKMHLMWDSKMLINGGDSEIVATSLLEASNLLVLKVFHPSQTP